MAMQTSRLTKVRAFKLMPKNPMVPKIEIRTEKTQMVRIKEVRQDPSRKAQTKKMQSRDDPRIWKDRLVRVRY